MEMSRWFEKKKQEHEMYFKNVDHKMKGMRSKWLNLSSGLKSQHPCRLSWGQRCLVKISGRCEMKEG